MELIGPCATEVAFRPCVEDESSTAVLTHALHGELRRIACRHLYGERKNHTLQPTALINEAYLKLAAVRKQTFSDDVHFLAVASRAMRQVLVDYARSRATQKRTGGSHCEALCIATLEVKGERGPELAELLHLDDALAALSVENQRPARLIEMRYFGGMTAEESAEALGISVHVVRHELRFAHAWLKRKLSS